MATEQLSFDMSRTEQSWAVPVRYVLDGVFLTSDLRVLVHEVPQTAYFSPGKIDLPSMEIRRVSSPHEMRIATNALMRAHVGISPTSCGVYPFMADRTIAPNNGGYRDTRRIFYKGSIEEGKPLPTGYRFIGPEGIDNISDRELWRRPSILDAINTAKTLLVRPAPEGTFKMTTHTDGAVSPIAMAQAQRVPWDLERQLDHTMTLENLHQFDSILR